MDLYIIIRCFQVKYIMHRNDLDLAAILYYNTLALRWRLRCCFQ